MSGPVRPERSAYLLSQIGAFSSSRFAELVRPLGLTPATAGALRLLSRSPGLSQRELADRLGAVPSRVVVLVDALEAGGFVARERHPDDRRNYRLTLTDRGREAMVELRAAAERQREDVLAPLSRADREQLEALLTKLSDAHALDPDVHIGYRDTTPVE